MYLGGQVSTDAYSTSLQCHLECEADYTFDPQKGFFTDTSLILSTQYHMWFHPVMCINKREMVYDPGTINKEHVWQLDIVRTAPSKPCMCRVTDFAFLFELLMKNCGLLFFFCCSGVWQARLCVWALNTPYTSFARSVISIVMSVLQTGGKRYKTSLKLDFKNKENGWIVHSNTMRNYMRDHNLKEIKNHNHCQNKSSQ